jgi:diaminopimelate decarboxylase
MPDVRSSYTDAVHFFGSVPPRELTHRFGSVLYVYNESILRRSCRALLEVSSHPGFRVNYSAKANSNPALLRIIREEGCLVDAMSPGELHNDILAGFAPHDILYVCNNVSADELRNAADHKVLVSVDSLSQLNLYGQVNPGGRVMIRINPGVGAGYHQKVVTGGKDTKFGIDPYTLNEVQAILNNHNLTLAGINQHIGSLFMEPDDYLSAVDIMLHFTAALPDALRAQLDIIDFGGGFGIPYHKYEDQERLNLARLGQGLHRRLEDFSAQTGYRGRFFVEPGRYLIAECGLLLGTVHVIKKNGATRYAGTDLGFNVLMRPILYDAFHDIEIYREGGVPDVRLVPQTIVGNICESGDILAKDRLLPELQEGDVIGILDAGAYGLAMASTYNQRPRPAEVLLTADGRARLIRRRETLEDMNLCLACEES